ncbi:unnamed protein product [Boreogadus saida]
MDDERLVVEVEKYVELYDQSSRHYKDNSKKVIAWRAIALEIGSSASMIPDNQSEPMFHAKQMVAMALLSATEPASEVSINADAERVFSVVGLNKTKTRNSLALDGTLSSIMTIKMADLEPCLKWEPPSDVLKASKKATGQYNRAHRS